MVRGPPALPQLHTSHLYLIVYTIISSFSATNLVWHTLPSDNSFRPDSILVMLLYLPASHLFPQLQTICSGSATSFPVRVIDLFDLCSCVRRILTLHFLPGC